MISDKLKNKVRSLYSNYSSNMPGFKSRGAQQKMIGEVAKNLSEVYEGDERPTDYMTPISVIEGATGTGKTASYLIGSIPVAMDKGKKLIISTATISLQEQLFNKDLPELLTATDIKLKYVLAKGRKRYCCPKRLLKKNPIERSAAETLKETMVEKFKKNIWNGERETWGDEIPQLIWSSITTDSVGCLGRSCQQYNICPFYKARKEMNEADLIVTNHDLVLSSLNMDKGVLPPPEQSVYIFDEAHWIPEKAINHNGSSHNLWVAINWIESMIKFIKNVGQEYPQVITVSRGETKELIDYTNLIRDFYELERALSSMNELSFNELKPWESKVVHTFKNGVIYDELRPLSENVSSASKRVFKAVSELREKIRHQVAQNTIDQTKGELILTEIGKHYSRAEKINKTWHLFNIIDTEGHPPIARWIECKKVDSGVEFKIAASAISTGQLINRLVWKVSAGVVLTSATLTALGSFDNFAEKAGLVYQGRVNYLRLKSPFNYESNAMLEIPAIKVFPNDVKRHTDEVIEWINQSVSCNLCSMVLFTSRQQMENVRQGMNDKLASIILMQGDLPKQKIIQIHKERADKGQGSIIFGLDSFSEGVDLPGEYLKHLIVSKIPFATPGTPINKTKNDWYESIGRNVFTEITIPEASIKLIQSVGRLIRTETDYGKVSILDRRLVKKQYGQQLLADLPPMRLVINE
jgi:ATP-dependent DNA helicase DinG